MASQPPSDLPPQRPPPARMLPVPGPAQLNSATVVKGSSARVTTAPPPAEEKKKKGLDAFRSKMSDMGEKMKGAAVMVASSTASAASKLRDTVNVQVEAIREKRAAGTNSGATSTEESDSTGQDCTEMIDFTMLHGRHGAAMPPRATTEIDFDTFDSPWQPTRLAGSSDFPLESTSTADSTPNPARASIALPATPALSTDSSPSTSSASAQAITDRRSKRMSTNNPFADLAAEEEFAAAIASSASTTTLSAALEPNSAAAKRASRRVSTAMDVVRALEVALIGYQSCALEAAPSTPFNPDAPIPTRDDLFAAKERRRKIGEASRRRAILEGVRYLVPALTISSLASISPILFAELADTIGATSIVSHDDTSSAAGMCRMFQTPRELLASPLCPHWVIVEPCAADAESLQAQVDTFECMSLCVAAQRHVYTMNMPTLTRDQMSALYKSAQTNGCTVLTDELAFAHSPLVGKVQGILAAKVIGELLSVSITQRVPFGTPSQVANASLVSLLAVVLHCVEGPLTTATCFATEGNRTVIITGASIHILLSISVIGSREVLPAANRPIVAQLSFTCSLGSMEVDPLAGECYVSPLNNTPYCLEFSAATDHLTAPVLHRVVMQTTAMDVGSTIASAQGNGGRRHPRLVLRAALLAGAIVEAVGTVDLAALLPEDTAK